MSPSSFTSLRAHSNKLVLRWVDSPSAPAYEFPVEIVDENDSGPILRAPLNIEEQTPVTLVAEDYTVNGIVRSCLADRNSYLITVATQDVSDQLAGTAYFRDPGVFVLDDFLTEEEEAKILESLGDSSRSLDGDSGLFTVFRCLQHFLHPGVAAARRLLWCPIPV